MPESGYIVVLNFHEYEVEYAKTEKEARKKLQALRDRFGKRWSWTIAKIVQSVVPTDDELEKQHIARAKEYKKNGWNLTPGRHPVITIDAEGRVFHDGVFMGPK